MHWLLAALGHVSSVRRHAYFAEANANALLRFGGFGGFGGFGDCGFFGNFFRLHLNRSFVRGSHRRVSSTLGKTGDWCPVVSRVVGDWRLATGDCPVVFRVVGVVGGGGGGGGGYSLSTIASMLVS